MENFQDYNESYIEGTPELPDIAYDALVKKQGCSPEMQGETSINKKNAHMFPMLSLEKAYTKEDIQKFSNRVGDTALIVQPKIDGIGISVRYENGQIQTATTRGTGLEGEDITQKVRGIVPNVIHDFAGKVHTLEGFCELRGELFIDASAFKELQTNHPHYKNSRNTIAGLVNSVEATAAELITTYWSVLFFDVLFEQDPLSTSSCLDFLLCGGFVIPYATELQASDPEIYEKLLTFLNQYKTLTDYEWPMDGLVIKVNDAKLKNQLGTTSTFPKWAIALKSNDAGVETVVLNILYQIGRTGAITPVAEIEPVEISGSTISRVTLNNLNYMQTMDVRPGDTVLVLKAGQVIPQIFEVVLDKRPGDSQPIDLEQSLAAQNIQTTTLEGQLVSTNTKQRLIQQILFYSKTLKIDQLGVSIIRQLVEDGSVQDFNDLYGITTDKLVKYINVGPKTANKVVQNIQATQSCKFADWLAALGIPGIGPVAAETLVNRLPIRDFDGFVRCKESALQAILGPKTGQQLAFWMGANLDFLDNFRDFDFQFSDSTTEEPLLGLNFVITGRLDNWSRTEISEYLSSLGGRIKSSVNTRTHYLIVGEKPSAAKVEKAEQLSIPKMTEDALKTFIKSYI